MGGAPPPTPPPNPVINVVPNEADFNSQLIGQTTPCFISTKSHFGTWLVTYQNSPPNKPSVENRYFYFNKQNVGGTVGVYDTTSPNWKPYADAAINAWSNALNDPNNIPNNGGYYAFSPALTTDASAPIKMYEVTTLPPDIPGQVSGRIDPSNWNYIDDMEIQFNHGTLPPTADGRELGHAQGLAHNPDIGSIMFPYVDDGSGGLGGCFTYGAQTQPRSRYDTDALEYHYDPVFVNPNKNSHCKIACPRPKPALKKLAEAPHPLFNLTPSQVNALVELTSTHVTRRAYAAMAAKRGIRNDGELRVLYNDPYFAREATFDDLLANSSLVVLGIVGPGIVLNGIAEHRDVMRRIVVSHVLAAQGTDASVVDGSEINITEAELADGDYVNDPSLKEGAQVLLFLVRARDPYHLGIAPNLYRTTYQFGAKWLVAGDGTVSQMGTAQTQATPILDGASLRRVFHVAKTGHVANIAARVSAWQTAGQAMLSTALTRRGITGFAQISARERFFNTKPAQLIMETNRRAGRPGWML